MVLDHSGELAMGPAAAWRRLTTISAWWSKDHTYSGDARNLRLDPRPGGCWCERWNKGAVEHARVLYVEPGKTLRIEGGFGPLQAMAVRGVMTFSLAPLDGGARTRVTVTYTVNGVPESGLDRLAPAIDQVLGEQIARLAGS